MNDGTIVNKVAASPLITFNLEDFLPKKVQSLDLSQWLEQGFIPVSYTHLTLPTIYSV